MSCSWTVALLPAGCTISDAAGKATSSWIDSIAAELASIMKSLMTFWIKAPDPDLSSGPGSVIVQIRDITAPIIAFSAVVGIIVAAVRMIRSTSDSESDLQELTRGLLLMVAVSAAGATVVELLESAFSQLAKYILDKGFNNQDVGQTLLKLFATTGGGIGAVIFGVLGIIVSAIQYAIMVLRGAILALLVGILPVAAAGALTDGGMQSFKKVCGWISAFVVYRAAAAVIYATAFLMLGSGTASGILFGMILVVLSILALPALLRLMPAGAAAMGGGGGGALGAMVGAVATGSMLLSGRGSAGAAAASSPTGSQTPGLKSPAGQGGGPSSPGPSGSPGAAGTSTGGGRGGQAGGVSGSPSGGSTTGGQGGRPALVGVGGSTAPGSGSAGAAGSGTPKGSPNGFGENGSGQNGSGQNGSGGGQAGPDGSAGHGGASGTSGSRGVSGSSRSAGTNGNGSAGGASRSSGGRFDNAMRALQMGQAAKGAGDAASDAATGGDQGSTS